MKKINSHESDAEIGSPKLRVNKNSGAVPSFNDQ